MKKTGKKFNLKFSKRKNQNYSRIGVTLDRQLLLTLLTKIHSDIHNVRLALGHLQA